MVNFKLLFIKLLDSEKSVGIEKIQSESSLPYGLTSDLNKITETQSLCCNGQPAPVNCTCVDLHATSL